MSNIEGTIFGLMCPWTSYFICMYFRVLMYNSRVVVSSSNTLGKYFGAS